MTHAFQSLHTARPSLAAAFGVSLLAAAPLVAGWVAAGAPRAAVAAPPPVTAPPAATSTDVDADARLQKLLKGAIRVTVRNESTGQSETFTASLEPEGRTEYKLAKLGMTVSEHWQPAGPQAAWTLFFLSKEQQAGHTVEIELPVLAAGQQLFTPTDEGLLNLDDFPTREGFDYGRFDWQTLHCWVLPLISVFNPATDEALTVALPPEQNIPQLQFGWKDAKTLRMTLEHRAMGGGKPALLELAMFAHAADYRSVIKAYSDAYPRYFRSPLPRGNDEGTFWYHHIQAHPEFAEMARQNVRLTWTSFWFTHLGEYLPDEHEWEPYTYSRQWKLGEKMSDEKIQAFIKEMHAHEIAVYAYFNVTEYGGRGGKGGSIEEARKMLREKYADALMKNAGGDDIPTWEGAMAMNVRRDGPLFPVLAEQVHRHFERLPELDGIMVDRLDWASVIDYGRFDGQTMIGDRGVTNMVGPIEDGLGEIIRQSHELGKRVHVNQIWRVETLRDVDGICHEHDFPRGLGYMSPYRPVWAWHARRPYTGDLLRFEAQMKQRLQFAVLPQMIAHEFRIVQQKQDAEAADLLEIYAPLFEQLAGKVQVLAPHCIAAGGANEVNLFVDPQGNYVVPLTSRVQFLSRPSAIDAPATVTIRTKDAGALRWAQVISADHAPLRGTVRPTAEGCEVVVPQHQTASIVVVGRGDEPPLPEADAARLAQVRERLFPPPTAPAAALPAEHLRGTAFWLRVFGTDADIGGLTEVLLDGQSLGRLADGRNDLRLDEAKFAPGGKWRQAPVVTLRGAADGAWFIPERVQLVLETDAGPRAVAGWTSADAVEAGSTAARVALKLAPCAAQAVTPALGTPWIEDRQVKPDRDQNHPPVLLEEMDREKAKADAGKATKAE